MSIDWEKCVLDNDKIESFKQNKDQYLKAPTLKASNESINQLIDELTEAFNNVYSNHSTSEIFDHQDDDTSGHQDDDTSDHQDDDTSGHQEDDTSDHQEDDTSRRSEKRLSYVKDLFFAVKMYKILEKFGFAERYAANRSNWVFLGTCIHALIQKRYPKTQDISELNRKYISNHRSWLRTLWWTVHLFIDFDIYPINSQLQLSQRLKKYLSEFEIDYPKQIMDRVGNGYLVTFYRIFMDRFIKRKGTFKNNKNQKTLKNRDALRAIIKFNTAKIVLIEPYLYNGSFTKADIEAYVDWLFIETMNQLK